MLLPRERIDRPELGAPALEPLDACLQLGHLLLAQLRRLRGVELGRLEVQPLGYRAQLLLRLLQLIMNPLRLHLRLRHVLAGLPQRALQLRLLARALAKLARHPLAGAATARELVLERLSARRYRLASGLDRRQQPLRPLAQDAVGDLHRAQLLSAGVAPRARTRHPLQALPHGGDLAFKLRATHGQWPAFGGAPALLDQPFAAMLGLARLRDAPLRLPQSEPGLIARVLRGAHALERVLDHAACHLLGLGGHALHAGEPLALVALGEQPPDSLPYHAPHVLPGLRPHASGACLLDHLIRPRTRLAGSQQLLLGSLGAGARGVALGRQLLQLCLEASHQLCLRL